MQKRIEKLRGNDINLKAGYDTENQIWNPYAEGAIPKNPVIDRQNTGNGSDNPDNLLKETKKLL